jgi:2-hydroxychromene-2-carboxylate isomerase
MGTFPHLRRRLRSLLIAASLLPVVGDLRLIGFFCGPKEYFVMTSSVVTSGPEIEFWFEFGSNYSYLSVMRIEDLAAKYGVRISWQPFLLGPIFQSFGWNNSPFVLHQEKGEYMQKDMARLCRKYGLPPWRMPTQFPRIGVLPLRVMLVSNGQPWIGEFAKRVMLLNFHLDRDINSRQEIASILTDLGQATADILAQAQSDPIKNRLRQQTETARARKIFGAPTFFVRGEMFWGNDRLDDALLFASEQKA